MAEPKVRGILESDTIPLKIPGNTITRGSVTVLTPADFPRQVPQDQVLLMHILLLNRIIRNTLVVEFARVRDLVRPRAATGPEDAREVGEANCKDLL